MTDLQRLSPSVIVHHLKISFGYQSLCFCLFLGALFVCEKYGHSHQQNRIMISLHFLCLKDMEIASVHGGLYYWYGFMDMYSLSTVIFKVNDPQLDTNLSIMYFY